MINPPEAVIIEGKYARAHSRSPRDARRLFAVKPICRAVLMLALLALALCACQAQPEDGDAQLTLDGASWAGGSLSPDSDDGLRVYVTLNGAPLCDMPFGETHVLVIRQADGSENTVRFTGESVFMESANCDNHDCVDMGEVTRENLEMRVMGGFIICLPHRISVEVRGE